MSTEDVRVRVITPHQHMGDIPDYHEWIYDRPIKCDRNGRPTPRIWSANWQEWICNNTDCPAFALVSNDVVRELIEAAS